eukprot:SAG31_NODE_6737_length_1905_cov_1.596346_1_plen_129_part_00
MASQPIGPLVPHRGELFRLSLQTVHVLPLPLEVAVGSVVLAGEAATTIAAAAEAATTIAAAAEALTLNGKLPSFQTIEVAWIWLQTLVVLCQNHQASLDGCDLQSRTCTGAIHNMADVLSVTIARPNE